MTYKYIIIDTDSQSSMLLQSHLAALPDFQFSGYANTREEAVNCVLEHNPDIVFLGNIAEVVDFSIVNELYKYLIVLPKFVLVSNSNENILEAIKHDVYDLIEKPFQKIDVLKTVLKFRKENSFIVSKSNQEHLAFNNPIANSVPTEEITEVQPLSFITTPVDVVENEIEPVLPQEISITDFKFDTTAIQNEIVQAVKQSLETKVSQNGHVAEVLIPNGASKRKILCVKSYGDYRFIEYSDIVYLKADNNSTDIILSNGDSITAFKTLKHFESSLPEEFMRVHNSHIVNIDYVSRIHLGNSDCYLNKGKIKLPFSKSYKENINTIIELFAPNSLKDD